VFSWEYADKFTVIEIEQDFEGSEGTLNITWNDRFAEILEQGEEFSLIRHKSGKVLEVPTARIWTDGMGRVCCCDHATDHYLSVKKGDKAAVVNKYHDRILAKKDGEVGWIKL
jgi:hypothetical protein